MRTRRHPYRDRPSGHRKTKLLLSLLTLAAIVFGGFVLQRDVRVDRTLHQRGVAATGTLSDTGCLFCRAIAVTFTTAAGQQVSTVVTAIGPQTDRAIHLRYDPRHPATVHPLHGVVEEEAIAGGLLVVGLVVLLSCTGVPRRRRRRHGTRVRTRSLASEDATGHVRLVGGD